MASNKAYHVAHPEPKDAKKIRAAAYRASHKEEAHEYHVEYKVEHPANVKARRKKYKAKHPEKALVYNARWRKKNPDKVLMQEVLATAKRRALIRGNTPLDELLTREQWLAILAEYNGHCAYCGKKAPLTLDHVIPLSTGGKHSKDNVVPACKHCNSTKYARTPEQWAAASNRLVLTP